MTLTISGDMEEALKTRAHEEGLTADRLARRVLAQALTPDREWREDGPSSAIGVGGEQKAKAFAQWANSHRDTPPLSDEAISRTSMLSGSRVDDHSDRHQYTLRQRHQ